MSRILKVLWMFVFIICVVNLVKDENGEPWIKDGDTIRVQDPSDGLVYDVRLFGIDAPEHDQEFGPEAKAMLTKLIDNKPIKMQVVSSGDYGRLLCKIYTMDNQYINGLMVQQGGAWYYEFFDKNDTILQQFTTSARTNKVGLWKSTTAIAPWDFRADKKAKRIAAAAAKKEASK